MQRPNAEKSQHLVCSFINDNSYHTDSNEQIRSRLEQNDDKFHNKCFTCDLSATQYTGGLKGCNQYYYHR